MKTCETPSTEVERSSSIPAMVLTAPSTMSVISVSISCGDAPGFTTVTVIVGRSIFGNRSTPSDLYENSPTTVRLRISIVAKTGRRTHISASFCMGCSLVFCLCACCRYCFTAMPSLSCSKLLVATFVRADTGFDLDQVAFGLARLHHSLFRATILITNTRLTPASVTTARAGINTAGSARSCRIRTVANCPGFNAPLLFSISASTVNVREVADTFGAMRATRPLKFLSGQALVVIDTDWPTRTSGIACSGTSMRIRKGLVLTIVATFCCGETYSPKSAVRSVTNPSMGEGMIA